MCNSIALRRVSKVILTAIIQYFTVNTDKLRLVNLLDHILVNTEIFKMDYCHVAESTYSYVGSRY